MATRLYPPAIAGTLPAFCGTGILPVPFSMNRAVGASEVAGFSLKIKTVTGVFLGTITYPKLNSDGKISTQLNKDQVQNIVDNMLVQFDCSKIDFKIGQHYKVQMAYIDRNNVTGIYSTVGVIKYTSTPDVYIQNLEFGRINQHNYSYVGVYSQKTAIGSEIEKDSTEKLYSSYFQITDEDNNVVIKTPEKLHKSFEDVVSYESIEEILVSQDLDVNRSYYIQFLTKSINGLEVNSKKYRIIQRRSISPDLKANLIATLDYDNGFIGLKLDTKEPIVSGLFLISRAASNNNYKWEEFKRFDLQSMIPNKWSLIDCTIEQGVTYKYSLQQYNDSGIYSDRIISNGVISDFEDAFLYDGEKQLKIRFNPKVSSFKTNVLESKVDTIGATHPYILRNGNTSYKDFPISGLISYQMDDTQLFIDKKEIGALEDRTNLSSDNIVSERLFKLKVLEWLTNGEAKLFRSPGEGNYIVRLMNVSLSPIDSLNRMLHSFSSTAYEVAKFNMDNLEEFGLIDARENISIQTRWATVDFLEHYRANQEYLDKSDICILNTRDAYRIEFRDMMPGTTVYIDNETIQIGATGAYMIDSVADKPFKQIAIKPQDMKQGQVTYSYKAKATNVFGTINKILIEDVPCFQWVGQYPPFMAESTHLGVTRMLEHDKVSVDDPWIKDISNWKEIYEAMHTELEKDPVTGLPKYLNTLGIGLDSILNIIEDVKVEILHIPFARFTKRPMIDVFLGDPKNHIPYYKENGYLIGMNEQTKYIHGQPEDLNSLKLYADSDCTQLLSYEKDFDPFCLYNVRFGRVDYEFLVREGYIVDRIEKFLAPDTGFYYNPATKEFREKLDDLYNVYIGDNFFSLEEIESETVKNISDYSKDIKISDGVVAELSFSKQIAVYSFEDKEPVVSLYKTYLSELKQYEKLKSGTLAPPTQIESHRQLLKQSYSNFIKALTFEIESYKEANGIV